MKIAMCQMRVNYGDAEGNLRRAADCIARAAQEGAELALLPETLDLGWANPRAAQDAAPIPGPRSQALSAAARENRIYVCAGLTEQCGGKTYNAAVLLDREGEVRLVHRKINLLTDVEGPCYQVGDRLAVAETELGVLGVSICADNSSSSLVLAESLCRMGAQIVLSPCAWAVPPNCARAYYGAEWYAPYARLARLYGVATVGVSSVGPVPVGAWAGWSCIGSSIALFPDGVSGVTLPYGEDAETLRIVDVPLKAPGAMGTALSAEVLRRQALERE